MKNFTLPKKVKIGVLSFRIEVVDTLKAEQLNGEKGNNLGHCDFQKQTIYILKSTNQIMFNTFLHEVFHAFNSEFKNEEIVQNFTDSLHRLIKDNPKIFTIKE